MYVMFLAKALHTINNVCMYNNVFMLTEFSKKGNKVSFDAPERAECSGVYISAVSFKLLTK